MLSKRRFSSSSSRLWHLPTRKASRLMSVKGHTFLIAALGMATRGLLLPAAARWFLKYLNAWAEYWNQRVMKLL